MKSEQQSDVEYLTSENLKGLPFSEAVCMGNVLYLSGQMGIDASIHLVSGGIAEETRQVDDRAALAANGYRFHDYSIIPSNARQCSLSFVFAAYGWKSDLSDEEILEKLLSAL